MTRIDFYQTSGEVMAFACRLIAQVYRKGHQIYVHTASEAEATQLDTQLWTYQAESFVPHGLQSAAMDNTKDSTGDSARVPIKIGCAQKLEVPHQEVLINLSAEIPSFFTQFARVAEVVPADEKNRATARQHYAFYRDKGHKIQYHNMG